MLINHLRQRGDDRGIQLIMTQVEFLKIVGEVRNNCGLDCIGPNYYIFIHKDLKRATVNHTGYICMVDVAYVLVVCAYNWKNWGCINTSLTQLLMVDNTFNPVDTISFGIWNFKGLTFTTHPGQWYNQWRPIPMMELSTNPSINNYEPRPWDEPDPFPTWEWPYVNIKNMTELLKSIQEFTQNNSCPHDCEQS